MPHYHGVIRSRWTPDRALAYMADFSNAAQWDPSVVSATRRDTGPVEVGSRFDLRVRMGSRATPLQYRVTALDAHAVTLEARTPRLLSIDTITVASDPADPSGASVVYDAMVRFVGIAAIANPVLALMFRRLGDRARASLDDHLNR